MRELWAAFTAAVPVCYFLAKYGPPPSAPLPPSLRMAMVSTAITLVAASFACILLHPLTRPRFLAALILCEAAALLGLAARYLTGTPDYYLPMLIALVGLILHSPKTV
jgi:hypothetical protein